MDLAAGAKGKPRRVIIQLIPTPFSQGWIGNIRKLAAAHWWDGTSINRVQDNYVVQWGDAAEKKALPRDLAVIGEAAYSVSLEAIAYHIKPDKVGTYVEAKGSDGEVFSGGPLVQQDPYADASLLWKGWPLAMQSNGKGAVIFNMKTDVWPVHCYGMVGVGRNLSPDTGSGAELYAVIGHAPRHLDRNIAVVGRVISGIEHLTSLPRGTGALGFYEGQEKRVPIKSIRLASELPATAQPKYEYLSTESDSFARYAEARRNRRDPFFIKPAGGADICNIAVPIRIRTAK